MMIMLGLLKSITRKKGRNWIIAASGGVKITPQATLRRARISAELEARRIESSVGRHDDWWWN